MTAVEVGIAAGGATGLGNQLVEAAASPNRSLGGGTRQRSLLFRTLTRPTGACGLVLVFGWVVVALFASLIAPHPPDGQNLLYMLANPGAHGFLLGSDDLGRDILSRVLFGARDALEVSGIGALSGSLVGAALGMVAGYRGDWADSVVMRIADLLLAYPALALGVMMVAVLGPGVWQVCLAIALINVPLFARLARAEVMRERELDYVGAARVQGCGNLRVLFVHVLPNTYSSTIVQLGISLGQAVMIEAALSFLGLGVEPPTPTWGDMLSESLPYLNAHPVFALAPGVALISLILGFNLLSDALRDATDPNREQR